MKNKDLDQAIKILGDQINADIISLSDVADLGENSGKNINNNIKAEVESYERLILLKAKLDEKKEEKELREKEIELKEQTLENERIKIVSLEKIENDKNKASKLASKVTLITGILGTAGMLTTCIINVVANRKNAKAIQDLAIMSMNLEYVDNGITPRSFNDAKHNLEGFLKK